MDIYNTKIEAEMGPISPKHLVFFGCGDCRGSEHAADRQMWTLPHHLPFLIPPCPPVVPTPRKSALRLPRPIRLPLPPEFVNGDHRMPTTTSKRSRKRRNHAPTTKVSTRRKEKDRGVEKRRGRRRRRRKRRKPGK